MIPGHVIHGSWSYAPPDLGDMVKRWPVVQPAESDDGVPKIIRNYKSIDRYGVTPELHKGLLEAYYASISYMDEQVGRVLEALDELGLRENTIVIFSSDHGYLLGHHHKFQKQHLFEESTRVPFIPVSYTHLTLPTILRV